MARGRLGYRAGHGSWTCRYALEDKARFLVNKVDLGLAARNASMGAEAPTPTPIVIPVRRGDKKTPRPRRGKRPPEEENEEPEDMHRRHSAHDCILSYKV